MQPVPPNPLEIAHQNVERLRAWASKIRRQDRRGIYQMVEDYLWEVAKRPNEAEDEDSPDDDLD